MPAVTAVTLVVLKTALDLGLILRIRIKPSGLREMLAADDEDDEPQRPQTEEAAPRATDRLASGPEDCSLLLSLPRPGIRATSRRFGSGLLATSLAFTLIGGMLFVLFGLVPIAMLVKSGLGFESVWVFVAPVFGVPIGGLLIAAGLYSLSTALRVGCARAEIRVREGELEIIERGLLGRRRVLFSRDEVELIDVAKSGAAVNNVPFWLLELRRRGGEPALELLYGRPEKELREVAHKLRRTLRLGPPDDVRR
ncbi:MAG TPA: hypothetical protein VML55_15110 [Planctomycetaceae bacterium]|nr:hypothetical protein [Planctomycetaceae bacterium]